MVIYQGLVGVGKEIGIIVNLLNGKLVGPPRPE